MSCWSCAKQADALKQCARCKQAMYCSPRCKVDWSARHKLVCGKAIHVHVATTPAAAAAERFGALMESIDQLRQLRQDRKQEQQRTDKRKVFLFDFQKPTLDKDAQCISMDTTLLYRFFDDVLERPLRLLRNACACTTLDSIRVASAGLLANESCTIAFVHRSGLIQLDNNLLLHCPDATQQCAKCKHHPFLSLEQVLRTALQCDDTTPSTTVSGVGKPRVTLLLDFCFSGLAAALLSQISQCSARNEVAVQVSCARSQCMKPCGFVPSWVFLNLQQDSHLQQLLSDFRQHKTPLVAS